MGVSILSLFSHCLFISTSEFSLAFRKKMWGLNMLTLIPMQPCKQNISDKHTFILYVRLCLTGRSQSLLPSTGAMNI